MNNYLLLLLLLFSKNTGFSKSREIEKEKLLAAKRAAVPDVIGKEQGVAVKMIKDNGLIPVTRSIFIQGGNDGDEGKVVDQVPKPGLARPGTEVKLTVSLGAPPEDEDESTVHLQIKQDVEDAQKQILVAQNKIEEAKTTILEAKQTILAAIAAKDYQKPAAGAPEKKPSS